MKSTTGPADQIIENADFGSEGLKCKSLAAGHPRVLRRKNTRLWIPSQTPLLHSRPSTNVLMSRSWTAMNSCSQFVAVPVAACSVTSGRVQPVRPSTLRKGMFAVTPPLHPISAIQLLDSPTANFKCLSDSPRPLSRNSERPIIVCTVDQEGRKC